MASEGRALPARDPKARQLYFLLGIYLFRCRCSGLQFSAEGAGKAAVLPQDSVLAPGCLHVFDLRRVQALMFNPIAAGFVLPW
jgi:hypothetical protein